MRRSDTVFYDAHCTICRYWKAAIEQADIPLVFADSRDHGRARSAGISDVQRLDREMCLVTANGGEQWGYDAMVGVLERLPSAAAVTWLLHLRPIRRIGRWVYRQIAQWRSCSSRAC